MTTTPSIQPRPRVSRIAAVAAVALVAALAAATGSADAAELTVSWARSSSDLVAGFEVEVLDELGEVVRVIDVRRKSELRVTGLEDGRTYSFRVRPYDRFGHKARQPSDAIVTMPEPRVDGVSGVVASDGAASTLLHGANFQAGARVVPRLAGVSVLETEVIRHDELLVRLAGIEAGVALGAADFIVVNPVRKAESFLRAHPEILDVDGSGTIDHADLDLVAALFGTTADDPRYRPELDLNNDGVIDGEDKSLVRSALYQTGG